MKLYGNENGKLEQFIYEFTEVHCTKAFEKRDSNNDCPILITFGFISSEGVWTAIYDTESKPAFIDAIMRRYGFLIEKLLAKDFITISELRITGINCEIVYEPYDCNCDCKDCEC